MPMHTLLLTLNSKQSKPIEEATNKINIPRIPLKMKTIKIIIAKEIFRREEYEILEIFFATTLPILSVA